MKEISVQDLKKKIEDKEDFQLIDVREEYEYDICNLKGELIPMAYVLDNTDKISHDKPVVIYCKSGKRSAAIINELEKKFHYTNLYNLKGGILEYAREVDPSLDQY